MVNRIFFALALLFLGQTSFAQYDQLEDYEKDAPFASTEGLLKLNLAFASGFMPNQIIYNHYLQGSLAYFPEKKVALRADFSMLLSSPSQASILKQNTGIYLGGFWHFIDKPIWDPYIGLQAGLHISQTTYEKPGFVYAQYGDFQVSPAIQFQTGVNFYINKYLHLSAGAQAIVAEQRGGKVPDDYSLTEFRAHLGLGLQFGLIDLEKKKNRVF